MVNVEQDIEEKFLKFARARAVGGDVLAARKGEFSAMPGATSSDLFGTLDILYAAHILGRLDDLTDAEGRRAWAKHIISFQEEDGWFRPHDKQSHGVEHATAYALGGLQILAEGGGEVLRSELKPLRGLQSEIVADPSRSRAPFALSLLQRVHFWRGSHRAAGLASIVGAVDSLGLPAEQFLGIAAPADWLLGWWAYFNDRIDPRTGYWSLAPTILQVTFNTAYQMRHDPQLASMGGAVHLYWIAEKIEQPMPHPEALIPATASLMEPSGLYEKAPYCIDLDANFLLGRALSYIDSGAELSERARKALAINRNAVLGWFAERSPENWKPNSHALPGAFAAIAEADRVLDPGQGRWRDIFETTWWL